VNSPSVLVSIRFFGMGKGMGGDISQIKRLYAAITCSNFERTLPPPRQALFSGILPTNKPAIQRLLASDTAAAQAAVKHAVRVGYLPKRNRSRNHKSNMTVLPQLFVVQPDVIRSSVFLVMK
jgi:hypothetical protein